MLHTPGNKNEMHVKRIIFPRPFFQSVEVCPFYENSIYFETYKMHAIQIMLGLTCYSEVLY